MSYLLLLGAILLTNLVHAKMGITCYECKDCKSAPMKVSSDNSLCFRIQMNCLAANIHIIDLEGDRTQSNYSLTNCGQTLMYSSACTVLYHCCYTDQCNTYESPRMLPSASPALFIWKRIVISFHLVLISSGFVP